MESVEKVAEAVLYEGYLLYPYRRSAMKNRLRWTFGGVYPRPHSEATGGDDPWIMQTQCLVIGKSETEIDIKVRFLHVVERQIFEIADGKKRAVERLAVDGRVYHQWEEAVEREFSVRYKIGDLVETSRAMVIAVDDGQSEEELIGQDNAVVGAIGRKWHMLRGEADISAALIGDSCYRLSVRITNDTSFDAASRLEVVKHSFMSTHTILRVVCGTFISLLEPPGHLSEAAKMCTNIRTWPVLAGDVGTYNAILSSPIILYDYPQVSQERHGDLFDGTEIDEILRLGNVTLADEEKQETR